MKTDDHVERERKRLIARLDNLENAQIGKDNALLTWVMMYGREPVKHILAGSERVNHINNLRKAGYLTNDWGDDGNYIMHYVLTKKAKQRLEHLSKQHNRSIKK
jgi:hypothetical protein